MPQIPTKRPIAGRILLVGPVLVGVICENGHGVVKPQAELLNLVSFVGLGHGV